MLDLVIQSFQLSSNTYAYVDLVIHQVVPMYTYVYFGFSNTEIWYFNIFCMHLVDFHIFFLLPSFDNLNIGSSYHPHLRYVCINKVLVSNFSKAPSP